MSVYVNSIVEFGFFKGLSQASLMNFLHVEIRPACKGWALIETALSLVETVEQVPDGSVQPPTEAFSQRNDIRLPAHILNLHQSSGP